MSTQPFPERDDKANDQAQGLYRKYNVRRVDGKPEKPGAEHFVLDAVHDKHAIPALQAYAASCMTEYPALAKDIARRWLMREQPAPAAPQTPNVAAAVNPNNEWRRLLIGEERLRAVGLSAEATAMLCGGKGSVPWRDLARRDGILALAALEDERLGQMREELHRQGITLALRTASEMGHFLYTVAEVYSPRGEWYDRSIVSAVACGLLMRLAEDAWGSRIEVAKALPH